MRVVNVRTVARIFARNKKSENVNVNHVAKSRGKEEQMLLSRVRDLGYFYYLACPSLHQPLLTTFLKVTRSAT